MLVYRRATSGSRGTAILKHIPLMMRYPHQKTCTGTRKIRGIKIRYASLVLIHAFALAIFNCYVERVVCKGGNLPSMRTFLLPMVEIHMAANPPQHGLILPKYKDLMWLRTCLFENEVYHRCNYILYIHIHIYIHMLTSIGYVYIYIYITYTSITWS